MTYQYIGQNVPRLDAQAKVTGAAHYVGDLTMPGMLYGKILRSPFPHASIKHIDVSRARQLPGVKAVLTYLDVPQNPYAPTGHPYPDDTPPDTLILGSKVRYVGDPVAALAAESPLIAAEALSLIEVDYEELPAVFTPEDALREGAPEIHAGSGNLLGRTGYEHGDVDQAFAQADFVFEDEFSTQIVTHCPIENHVSLAYLEPDGRLTVHSATQIPHTLRRILAKALGMPIGRIRVLKTLVGGGFGGKQDVCQEPLNAVLAIATHRPVLLEFSREEDIVGTRTRHAASIRLRTALTAEGRVVGREMQVVANSGAYSSHGHCVSLNMGSQFAVLYPAPNIRFNAITTYTNIPIAGAMRGYGIPQLTFAVESHMDNIAKALQRDPIELRRQNLCQVGDQDPVTHIKVKSCEIRRCLEQGEQLSNWQQNRQDETRKQGRKKKGLGVACFSYASCTWPEQVETAGARIQINEDSSATLFIGSADIGQGSDTVMAQIAAEELGIPIETIYVKAVDTDVCPLDLGAYASRQVYVSGAAVRKAAGACKQSLLQAAAGISGRDKEDLDIRRGRVVRKETGEDLGALADITMQTYYDLKQPTGIGHEAFYTPDDNALSFGATFAEVAVDTVTGKIDLLKIWAVHDSGRIINPQLAEGQVHGGVAMGAAYALSEQILIDSRTGKVLNDNLLDYKVPTIMDIPEITALFVDSAEPSGVFGAKSLGEPPLIPVAPAIRNAVLDALGIGFNELPLTPEKISRRLWELA